MKRRFNFTGRQRITRDKMAVTVKKDGRVIESFDISLKLSKMELPSEARVYIEAYHRTDIKRFRFGTVNRLTVPDDTNLSNLAHQENLMFRILVVDETNNRGLILAMADKIKPEVKGEKTNQRKSILPVQFKDLGKQVWSVVYDDGPLLVLNGKIPGMQDMAKFDLAFFFQVYPAVIREILTRIFFVAQLVDLEEPDEEWQKSWLEFSKVILPNTNIPDPANAEQNEILEWIDKVIEEFCASKVQQWRKYVQIKGGEN